MTVKVVYHSGAFVPEDECNLPEGAHGIVVIEPSNASRPAGEQDRKKVLLRLVEEMRENPLPVDSPRFSRDSMHERG